MLRSTKAWMKCRRDVDAQIVAGEQRRAKTPTSSVARSRPTPPTLVRSAIATTEMQDSPVRVAPLRRAVGKTNLLMRPARASRAKIGSAKPVQKDLVTKAARASRAKIGSAKPMQKDVITKA